MADFENCLIKDNGEELKEKLIDLLDLWSQNMNWKIYKHEYFPLKSLAYYRYIQWPASDEVDPIDSNKKRNDFVYWELKEIGYYISLLNEVGSRYSIHSPAKWMWFTKDYEAIKERKKAAKTFLKEIRKEPASSKRGSIIKNQLDQSNLEDAIYFTSIIYKDFCKIHEYLNTQFDSSITINPLVKSDPWAGTLAQTVLYHVTLINSGVEPDIDRNDIQKECGILAEKYGFTGYKRFSDYFNAIDKNKKKVRGSNTFNYKDGEFVEKALKENYPERPDIIENLYNKTRPIYP